MLDPAPDEQKPHPLPCGHAEPVRLDLNIPAVLAVAALGAGIYAATLSGPVIAGEASDWDGLKLNALAIASISLGLVACLVSLARRKRSDASPGLTGAAILAMLIAGVAAAAPRIYHLPLYESGGRTRCPSNLRQIGQAAFLYAYDHAGHFPDDVDGLLTQDITPSVFVCNHSADTPARVGPTTQATVANVKAPGHCSYIYLGKGWTDKTATADVVIAYESMTNHGGQGMNVLYGDGHVDWVQAGEARAMLAELAASHNPPRQDRIAAMMRAEAQVRRVHAADH